MYIGGTAGVAPPNGAAMLYKPVGGAHAPTKYDPGVNAVRLDRRSAGGTAPQRRSDAL